MPTPRKPAVILRAAEIAAAERTFTQRLNPGSLFHGSELSRPGGLTKYGVSWARLPPGKESFAYHAHDVQEEWMFALSGRAVALSDGVEHPVALMGGERPVRDVLTYPALGERYLLRGEEGRAAFYKLGDPVFPFGLAEG
jgi:hypothetical protein